MREGGRTEERALHPGEDQARGERDCAAPAHSDGVASTGERQGAWQWLEVPGKAVSWRKLGAQGGMAGGAAKWRREQGEKKQGMAIS